MQHVFIIGSKGIPANYGGYETFVEKLTENQTSSDIKYHVACAVEEMPREAEFEHNGVHCFNVKWRPYGAARAIFYDTDALDWCVHYIKRHNIQKPLVYVLACRIGPFFKKYVKKIHSLGGQVYVNPDGHEWMRAKWSAPIRRYWKISEGLMVKHTDLLVCDSKNIEKYIHSEYSRYNPKTTYIAYGADIARSNLSSNDYRFTNWLVEKGLKPNRYYLVVGRFVPENNYETMIREFMASDSKMDFALITAANDAFLDELQEKTGFKNDPRVKFVGTVYDQNLLKKIREQAFAYFHGHEVGGTNPSLLEALSSTRLNLLLDVGFNQEVAGDSALYWTKKEGSLSSLIHFSETLSVDEIERYDQLSSDVIEKRFSWSFIVDEYEKLFLKREKESA
jgi:rhamnosyltransferase